MTVSATICHLAKKMSYLCIVFRKTSALWHNDISFWVIRIVWIIGVIRILRNPSSHTALKTSGALSLSGSETHDRNLENPKCTPESRKPTSEHQKPNPESWKPTSEHRNPNPESWKPTSEHQKPNPKSWKTTSEHQKPNPEFWKWWALKNTNNYVSLKS